MTHANLDSEFNFQHRLIGVSGIRYHVVEAGEGTPLILLAGFPQSWYAWRRVMKILSPHYKLIAIDLPGQGDSDKPASGYDTLTTADRIHGLIAELGYSSYLLGGHDIGAWVAYPYAAKYGDEVRAVALLDANIPGITLKENIKVGPDSWKSWHFLFHPVSDLPEALLTGREKSYIEWFFQHKSANPAATFTTADIEEYVRAYTTPGNLRGALAYYRAVFENIEQNRALPLVSTPILALGGDVGMAPDLYDAMRPLAKTVEGGVIAQCGHYMPEEQPAEVAARMHEFFTRVQGLTSG